MANVQDVSINELEINIRAWNALSKAGIKTLGEIDNMTDRELLQIRGVGRETLHGLHGIRCAVANFRNQYHQGPTP